MDGRSRRDWLRLLGSAGAVSIAGCSSSDNSSADDPDESPASSQSETPSSSPEATETQSQALPGRRLGEAVEFGSRYRVRVSDYATFTNVQAANPYNPEDPSTIATHSVQDGFVYLAVKFSVTNLYLDGTELPTDFGIRYEGGNARLAYQLHGRHWETDAETVYHSYQQRYEENGGDLGCCANNKTVTGWVFYRVPDGFDPSATQVSVLVWRRDESESLEWVLVE